MGCLNEPGLNREMELSTVVLGSNREMAASTVDVGGLYTVENNERSLNILY